MADETLRKIFAKKLNYYLAMSGKNQSDLCKYMKVSSATVSDWCNANKMPRADKIQKISEWLGVGIGDLMEDKPKETILNTRDERDIAKRLDAMLYDLENQQNALMFNGEALDDTTKELLKASLENSLRVAKINAKEKFTPKKYRKK